MRADVTKRIKQLGRAGKPREAVAELASMARLGIQPDTLAATALVDACARNGKMDMARRWGRAWAWLACSGLAAGLQHACARLEDPARRQRAGKACRPPAHVAATRPPPPTASPPPPPTAPSVFDELFGGGLLAPDEVVFAVLLRGYGTASSRPRWDDISSTLTEMERAHAIPPSTGARARCGG